jgi:hypothetical protein
MDTYQNNYYNTGNDQNDYYNSQLENTNTEELYWEQFIRGRFGEYSAVLLRSLRRLSDDTLLRQGPISIQGGIHPIFAPEWLEWRINNIAHEIQKLLYEKQNFDTDDQVKAEIDYTIYRLKRDFIEDFIRRRRRMLP